MCKLVDSKKLGLLLLVFMFLSLGAWAQVEKTDQVDLLEKGLLYSPPSCPGISDEHPQEYTLIRKFLSNFSFLYFYPDKGDRKKIYRSKEMVDGYKEKDRQERARVFSEWDLIDFKIHFHWSHDGLLYDRNGNLLDTHGQEYIFVMNENGEIFINKGDSSRGVYHSSFFAGAPVSSAGTIVIRNGRLVYLSNFSGHYRPSSEIFDQVLTEFKSKGVSVNDADVDGEEGKVKIKYFSF